MTRYMFNIATLVLAGVFATRAEFVPEVYVLSAQEKAELLDDHNILRSETALGNSGDQPAATNMVALVWDESLAESSKAHAETCVFGHSDSGYGENLAASGSSVDSLGFQDLKAGITKWHDEHEFYNFASGSCTGVCGHYTQVVWAKSVRVGCAYQMCGPGFIWDETIPFQLYFVCQYDPPGNYASQKPYLEAASDEDIASECPSDLVPDKNTGLCVIASATATPTIAVNPTPAPTVVFTGDPTVAVTGDPTMGTSTPTNLITQEPTTVVPMTPVPTLSMAPTSICKGLKRKNCRKNDACAYGSKRIVTCYPNKKRVHDCSQYSKKRKCIKQPYCEYKSGTCKHRCDDLSKKECALMTKKGSSKKICSFEKEPNPCKKCNSITCSS